jgi:acetyl-CoA carboxylase carboxyltransferase component
MDEGTFTELGIHGQPHFSQQAMAGREAPADGVITGYGRVDGRFVAVAAYDFTVMAGSMGYTGEVKVARIRGLARTQRMPMVWLLDSAGARIQEAVGSLFAGSGQLFQEEVVTAASSRRSRRSWARAPRARLTSPAWPTSCPWSGGAARWPWPGPTSCAPRSVSDVSQEELGGSRVHCRRSGVGDLEVADDPECIARIREYLSFFPSPPWWCARPTGPATSPT